MANLKGSNDSVVNIKKLSGYHCTKLLLVPLILLLSACSSSSRIQNDASSNIAISAQQLLSKQHNLLFKEPYEEWKGTPYRYGGSSKSGVDCSAFVQAVFQQASATTLPRTTLEQSKSGKRVDLDSARSGDLLFFKTGYKDRHVGIYLGDNRFMHASTSKGVIISRLNNPYWASAFWQVRRVD
jgi:cell wall-associated NlpC family hydrolase